MPRMKGDLRGVARARALSRATVRNIRQNLFFAFVYNALGVPLAAGVLDPVVGWLLGRVRRARRRAARVPRNARPGAGA
jgi:Cu+-exporting ATPase